MKILKAVPEIEFDIDVTLPCIHQVEVAATKVIDLPSDISQSDPLALDNYYAFRESVEEVFEYYGFQLVKYRTSNPSRYYYYAHESQIVADNVPKYIKLRVSAHAEQHKSEEHLNAIKERTRQELEEIKRPKSKLKQRYMPLNITVNSKRFNTYEKALEFVESQVRDLFSILHLNVDVNDYESLGEF